MNRNVVLYLCLLLSGCGSNSTVQKMVDDYLDESKRKQVAAQLTELPASSINDLFESAKSSDNPFIAASMFANLRGPARAEAAKLAGDGLENDDVDVQRLSVLILRMLVADSKPAAPKLIEMLKSIYPDMRLHAAIALTGSGYDRNKVVAALQPLTLDAEVDVRLAAINCLEHLTTTEELIPILVKCVKSHEVEVARRASYTLAKMGGAVKPVITDMLEATRHHDIHVCCNAIRAIGGSGVGEADVISRLAELLKSQNRAPRLEAVVALGKLKYWSEAAVPALIPLLQDTEDADMLEQTAKTLGEIGPFAREAEPALMKLQDHESNAVREAVAVALYRIDDE